jgi:hypothetical protein
MHNVKHFLMGVGATALSILVLFFALRQFAPEGVKSFFRV